MKTQIRVLHIFPPSLKSRFGGQNITWKYNFSKWKDPRVRHLILDTISNQVCQPYEIFNFEYPKIQKQSTMWERLTWIIRLFIGIVTQKKEYDVLHLHVLWWGGLLIGPWAKWKRIPTIYESVLLEEDTPSGIAKQNFGTIKLCCLKMYRSILAISDPLAEDYLKNGFRTEQIFMLMNSVDTELFKPVESVQQKTIIQKKFGLPTNSKILLFVGSVIERKGLDTLIQAFIKASQEDHELYLLIVGAKNKRENPSIDEDFINSLHILLKQEGIEEKVSFIGLIQDRTQLAEIYRASDIFLFPSRNEGLGNVILEAMATGLSVVASRLPVLEKVISHGENGLFIPIEDTNALKDTILALDHDPKFAHQLGENARSYVIVNHAYQAWQLKLVDFYKYLMK